MRTYLERDGFAVVTAADGPAALDAIETPPAGPRRPRPDAPRAGRPGRHPGRPPRRRGGRHADPRPVGPRLDASTGSPASRTAPTTTCPSRSRRPSWSCASSRSCAARRTDRPPTADDPRRRCIHADLVVDLDRHEVTRDGEPIPLTRVEFRLLQTILEADGRVLTRDQLLDAVYGQDQAEVLDRTVDVHIGRLRDKLGDDAERSALRRDGPRRRLSGGPAAPGA